MTPFLSDEASRCRATARGRMMVSIAPPAGSTTEWRRPSPQHRAARHRRRQSDAAVGEDPAKVARASKANSIAYNRRSTDRQFRHQLEHHRLSGPSWAKLVFPDDEEDVAVAKLADAIFSASRVDHDDAIAAGRAQRDTAQRTEWLNGQRLMRCIIRARHRPDDRARPRPRMARRRLHREERDHLQRQHPDRGGIHHAARKAGQRARRQHQAAVLSGFADRRHRGVFRGRPIVEAKATRGEEVLKKVLDTDEGAPRLGEVALVPHSSPISKSGLLFFNTLFDENAACHIALGQCYSKCFVDGKLTPEQIAAQGGNKSLIHIDWMIGSARSISTGFMPTADACRYSGKASGPEADVSERSGYSS